MKKLPYTLPPPPPSPLYYTIHTQMNQSHMYIFISLEEPGAIKKPRIK